MGLGQLFTRAIEYKVTNTVTQATQTFYVHGDPPLAADWSQGRYRGAMSIPGAWRSSLILSDLIGRMPFHAYRERGGAPIERVSPTPPLLEQPAPPETAMTTWSSMALDLIHDGNAVALIAARDYTGWPTALVPIPASMVGVRRITDPGMSTLPVGALEYSIGTLRNLGSGDVLHVKGPCEPGALRGMGVLENHMATLNLAAAQREQAGNLANHGVPTGVLKTENPDLTQAEADELKARWLASQRNRTIAVLNATTSFQPLAWNPEEMQLVEGRKFSLQELALIYGVPFSFLGVEAGSKTYRNDETESINIVKWSVAGHLERFEQALSLQFPRGTRVRANLSAILRSDTLSRYEAHKIALDGKFLTDDEVRELEDRPPLTAAQRKQMTPTPPPPPPAPAVAGPDESEKDNDDPAE